MKLNKTQKGRIRSINKFKNYHGENLFYMFSAFFSVLGVVFLYCFIQLSGYMRLIFFIPDMCLIMTLAEKVI